MEVRGTSKPFPPTNFENTRPLGLSCKRLEVYLCKF